MSLYLLDMDKLAIDLRKESVLKHFNKKDRIKIGNPLLERLIPELLISIKHNIIDTQYLLLLLVKNEMVFIFFTLIVVM